MTRIAVEASVRAAIGDVIACYCQAIDRRRWELMPTCFHDDASYALGPIDGTWRDFVDAAKRMIDPLLMTHHQLGQTVHVADGMSVRTESYFTATHHVSADAAVGGSFAGRGHDYLAIMTGRYLDEFTCRDGVWKIAQRDGRIDSRHDVPLSGD